MLQNELEKTSQRKQIRILSSFSCIKMLDNIPIESASKYVIEIFFLFLFGRQVFRLCQDFCFYPVLNLLEKRKSRKDGPRKKKKDQ